MTSKRTLVLPKIEAVINALNFETIPEERKLILLPLIDFIQEKHNKRLEIRLNFICTHNSRRSHLSQVWAQTAAAHYSISPVFSYSGGTQATALFPMVVQTLINQGFQSGTIAEGINPVYAIKYSENEHPIIGFSKIFDADFNPKSDFAAILSCSSADQNCPFISGAEKRISIQFEDPKVFDNLPEQAEKYEERSLQIATEMCFIFSQIK